MIQHISAAHKTDLEENFNTDMRFYFNPRGSEYPPISGTPAYSAITSADQMPGTFNLDTCDLQHLIQWTDPITFEIMVHPHYAYNVAGDQAFMRWISSGTEYFDLCYVAASDRFAFRENVGTAASVLFGPTFTADADLQAWQRLTIVSNGTVLWAYFNGVKYIGAVTPSGALHQYILKIPGNVDHLINYVRIFPSYAATDDDVADSFRHVVSEEIYFDFNKTAVGRARCNLHTPAGKCYVTGYSMDRSLGYKAAGASLSLNNLAGEFSDDQFAAFDPTAGSYNGTSAQKYLARKIPIEIETHLADTDTLPADADGLLYIDTSGNGKHGTIAGCTTVTDATYGKVLSFDGVNDYVLTPVSASGATEWTLTTWIKPRNVAALGLALAKQTTARPWLGVYSTGKFAVASLVAGGASGAILESTTSAVVGTWYHVCATHDGTTLRLYINGKYETQSTQSMSITAAAFCLGSSTAAGTWLDGDCFGQHIYSRAQSASEVAGLYAGVEPSTTGLVARYVTTWPVGTVHEPLFIGACPPGSFARSTQSGGISTVSISADDGIADMARRVVRTARKWAGYYLSRATPASNSVFHEVAYLATKREVYNYFGNSSFENATISNSWTTDGTFARDTTAVLMGTYCGKYTGNEKTIGQEVTFLDPTTNGLSAGERFTASFFIYSASAITGHLYVRDKLGAVEKGSTDAPWTHSGLGWDLIQCTHSVVDSTSDRIATSLLFHGNLADVPVDCASLVYGDYKPFFVNNTNDGAAGVTPSSSAMLGSYDWIGVSAEDIADVHPWARIGIGEKVWDHIKMIGDAGIARYIGIDHSGVLVFKSMLASALPASLGSLPAPNAIGSGQQDLVANKVKVQGAYFELRDRIETVWQAEASGLKSDSSNTGSKFRRTLANGATIPDPSTTLEGASVYEARYGDITDKNYSDEMRGH